MNKETSQIPDNSEESVLDRLRSGGRKEGEGQFTIDYEKKNARAWEAAQTIEGAMDKVGLGLIQDAVREVLKDIDTSGEKIPWDHPPQKELRDARARAEAARWGGRLVQLIKELHKELKKEYSMILRTTVGKDYRFPGQRATLEDHIKKGLLLANLVRQLQAVVHGIKSADFIEYVQTISREARENEKESEFLKTLIHHPELDWLKNEVMMYRPRFERMVITIDGKNKQELVEELRRQGICTGPDALEVIGTTDAIKEEPQIQVELIRISVESLDYTGEPTLGLILRRMRSLGLKACSPEICLSLITHRENWRETFMLIPAPSYGGGVASLRFSRVPNPYLYLTEQDSYSLRAEFVFVRPTANQSSAKQKN